MSDDARPPEQVAEERRHERDGSLLAIGVLIVVAVVVTIGVSVWIGAGGPP